MLDQEEHINRWYKFGGSTWCYKHHPSVRWAVFTLYGTLCPISGLRLLLVRKPAACPKD